MNRTIVVIVTLLLACAAGALAADTDPRPSSELRPDFRVAVLPVDNLTGAGAPVHEIRRSLMRRMGKLGAQVIDDASLRSSMAKHRIRYTGGVDTKMSRFFKDELQADAILVTSLELYMADAVPKIALTCRLVSTEAVPQVIWIQSVGLTGEDSPGLLGLGLIGDPVKLREKAIRTLVSSLKRYLALSRPFRDAGWGFNAFRPKEVFVAAPLSPAEKKVVAIIPFKNKSTRKSADQIALLHFAEQLWNTDMVRVVEPGVIRERMLAMRSIMSDGFSYRDMDLIAGEMGVDVFLSGKVYEYRDYQFSGTDPVIDFSALAIQHKDRKFIWASNSYNKGDDAVYIFDFGRVTTASAMAVKMMQAVVERMLGGA
ncbi:MAG TPA: hypothetical protein VF775_04055 [Geobacteraceae bacterium]